MKKRGRPSKKSLQQKIEEASTVETVTENKAEPTVESASQIGANESKQQQRPDPSNRAKRRRVSSVGGAGSGGKLGIIGDLDPNYNYRVCNDEGSNIQEMESFGYDIVTGDGVSFKSTNEINTGSQHSVIVDRTNGTKGILMRQPKEYHDEDNKARADMIAKTEESMFRNVENEEGRYGSIDNTSSLAKKTDS